MEKFQIQNGVLVKYMGDDTCVTVPEGVRVIGGGAFSKCKSLQKIIIPEGVCMIRDFAFCNCKNLQEIDFSSSVHSVVGGYVFAGCKNLRTINIDPKNPYFSSEEGFLFNKSKTVLLYMFQRKETVSVPDGVEYISIYAFRAQDFFDVITLPDSVTEIAEGAFMGCPNLCEFIISPNNPYFSYEDGILYGKNKTQILFCRGDKEGDVHIPDSVIEICDWAFACCDIQSITIPDSVISTGEFVFGRREQLKTVRLSKNSTLTEEDLCLPENCELVRI